MARSRPPRPTSRPDDACAAGAGRPATNPVTEARGAALELRLATARGLRLDVAFRRAATELEPRERAFCHELAYGTARLQGRLDHLLERRVRGGIRRLDPPLLEILRLGAYEALYMDGVPAYAAVSQAVEHAAAVVGRGAAGLANAVLRGVVADGASPDRFPARADDPVAYLAAWGSHPRWLVERWLARWAFPEVEALVAENNRKPPLTLVPLDAGPDEAARAFRSRGVEAATVGGGTGCVRLGEGVDPTAALALAPAVAQDPGANLVTLYADVPPGTKVADLCAAPGGKALVTSSRSAYTVAADRSEIRMRTIRKNARRTGRRMGLVVADARRPPFRETDVVLVDVPCTGTGTLRRRPDARWRLRPGTVGEMAALQRDLLDGAAGAVAPGGLLVYSTCSLEPEENEERVAAFLARRTDFVLEPTGAVPATYLDDAGCLRVLPQASGFDGAFAARLRRAR